MGYVPQGREIFSQLTVEENLRNGLAARLPKLREVPDHVYQMFPVLKQMLRPRNQPHRASSGAETALRAPGRDGPAHPRQGALGGLR